MIYKLICLLFMFILFFLLYFIISILLKKTSKRELIAWGLIFDFIIVISNTFTLALFGLYNLRNMSIVFFVESILLLCIIIVNKYKIDFKFSVLDIFKGINKVMLIALIFVAIIYFFFPTKYLWARRDPALYVINGVNIAKTGSMDLNIDEYLNLNYDEIKGFVDLEYRGIYSDYEYGDSDQPGKLTSQFLQYFSSALAFGYSFGGLSALFRVNAIIGVLCFIIVYYFVKKIWGKNTATIAAILLALNPAQIWCARIPQTELLYQLFFILGIYIISLNWHRKNLPSGVLGGAILGFIGLNRIDAYILGLGILLVCAYFVFFEQKMAKYCIFVVIGYLFAMSVSLIYSYTKSYYYIVEHWDAGVLNLLIYANIACLILIIIGNILRLFMKKQKDTFNILKKISQKKEFRLYIIGFLFIVFLFIYFIRPDFQTGLDADFDFNQRALVEFCWYVSFLAFLLAFVGLWKIMKSYSRCCMLSMFLACGLASVVVYIYRPAIAPDHIWASRRWVSVCFPFIIILASVGIKNIYCVLKNRIKTARLFCSLLACSLLCFCLYQSRVFLFQPMLNELPQQYNLLSNQLDSDTIYFAEMSHYASILKFVYEKQVYVLKDKNELEVQDSIWEYINETQQPIYYIGSDGDFGDKLQATLLYSGEIRGTYINQTVGEYFTELTTTGSTVNVYMITAKNV
ncbi:hypothetical protein HNP82_001942 [Catenibacillus scindens]|uniref:Glycosyltransferase RgtA/B/C/D-like domain-containing protein n=1 Tax=Catenibacillus scindens TaxID=673271 RepID=A0A7W8M531_9FIRM|nr:glycosyltransferase family 39 protein [Catenibacillus scindens]MBB5264803.1 hypothetical protein [Catenibacillus scindens]